MRVLRRPLRSALLVALAASIAMPLGASTFRRASLDQLVKENTTIVVGEVLKARSYWSEEGSFILTDLRVRTTEALKGAPRGMDFTVTVLGGSVGELTTLIIGGAELVPGNSYVLFLSRGDLTGARDVLTVRDHAQGVFDIMRARDGLRAISQAHRVPLVADALGFVDPPGGAQGLPLAAMIQSIREISARRSVPPEVQ